MVAFGGYLVVSLTQEPTQTTTVTIPTTQFVTSTESPVVSAYNTTYSTISAHVNTYFTTYCTFSGVGGFEFRIVSDSTGAPVNPDSMIAVDVEDQPGCGNQAVYTNEFSYMEEADTS